jgi:hypothetical protein
LLGWWLFVWGLFGWLQNLLDFWAWLVWTVDPLGIFPGIVFMVAMGRFPVEP